MLVAELIEALKAFPATAEVWVENAEGAGSVPADGVRKHTTDDKIVSITFYE